MVEVLRAGGLILYPTDTVWGIGCDATNEEAVKKAEECTMEYTVPTVVGNQTRGYLAAKRGFDIVFAFFAAAITSSISVWERKNRFSPDTPSRFARIFICSGDSSPDT